MDILSVLDDLKKLAVEQPRTLLIPGLTWGLHQDEIDMQIVKIRSMLPDEVKAAAVTVRESDRIIEAAKQDARTTNENARREADRIVAEAAEYIGIAVANVINLLNPEVVVLGGGLIEALEDEMMGVITKTAMEHVLAGTAKGISIIASKLADEAGITGGAVLARREVK